MIHQTPKNQSSTELTIDGKAILALYHSGCHSGTLGGLLAGRAGA